MRRNNTISIFEVNKPSHDCANSRFLFTEDVMDVSLQQSPIQGSNNLNVDVSLQKIPIHGVNNLNVNVRNYDISEDLFRLVGGF